MCTCMCIHVHVCCACSILYVTCTVSCIHVCDQLVEAEMARKSATKGALTRIEFGADTLRLGVPREGMALDSGWSIEPTSAVVVGLEH